ncbi:hypothetical protein Q1695_002311 [Nippostrongylus brasiliensis]|nr:hypothetical protein Q1695_002311 [Nippostrongylus brasiliensis]
MTEKSGTGAPSGTGDPEGGTSGNQEGADDKDEKKELDGTGAGSTMGGATEGTTGGASKSGKKSKKGKKGKKGKKKKTAHFKQETWTPVLQGALYRILTIVTSKPCHRYDHGRIDVERDRKVINATIKRLCKACFSFQ